MEDIDYLFGRLGDVEDDIFTFFDGDEYPNYGDRGYQRLLEERDEIQETIDALHELDSLYSELKSAKENRKTVKTKEERKAIDKRIGKINILVRELEDNDL